MDPDIVKAKLESLSRCIARIERGFAEAIVRRLDEAERAGFP